MKEFEENTSSLAGSLLLAHPGLPDPNFRRSVVLVSAHTREDGAWGAIINRPSGKRLGEIETGYSFGALAEVPLYDGGPVNADQVILAGWSWMAETAVFKLHFGIDPDQARELLEDTSFTLRAFRGYAGWESGQLENELKFNSWLVAPLEGAILDEFEGADLWRHMVSQMGPEMRLMADFPNDPSGN